MPKFLPIKEAVRANLQQCLDRMENLKRNDPFNKTAEVIEPKIKNLILMVDGKEPLPEPAPFVCRYPGGEAQMRVLTPEQGALPPEEDKDLPF